MKTTDDRRHRLSLTLLFSGLVFLFLLMTMILVVLIILLLVRVGVLSVGGGELRTGFFLLVIGLTSVLIGTILSFTVGRFPLRSVNSIINAMNRLAAGDFKTRLQFGGVLRKIPVAQELTESFNKMASELENTELLRSDFINNFSHEFKTPIVSIAGFAKLLRKGNLNEQEKQEYLGIIEDEALRLSAMATNVLNLSRVENQTILTGVTTYNLSEQLRGCVLLLEDQWTKKNLELILNFKEFDVTANAELLKQIWLNLLDNAVKFTPDYGLIEIAVEEDEAALSVSVVNSGQEILPENLDRIFQKFYQADESHATEGNGIGLAVVQKIVQLHRGHIEVESHEGRTAFTVVLPKEIGDAV